MKDSKKKLPSREITINIQGKEYTVKFPNTGQLIDIETMKVRLSGDAQKSLLYSSTPAGQQAFVSIEAISTFTVLCPDMIKDLNMDMFELSPIDLKPILKEYTDKIHPWFAEWYNIINEVEEDDEKPNSSVE